MFEPGVFATLGGFGVLLQKRCPKVFEVVDQDSGCRCVEKEIQRIDPGIEVVGMIGKFFGTA